MSLTKRENLRLILEVLIELAYQTVISIVAIYTAKSS